jgi:hypothetical protein
MKAIGRGGGEGMGEGRRGKEKWRDGGKHTPSFLQQVPEFDLFRNKPGQDV